ncbi:MAG: YHS domain protein [Bacteroidetes bacterium]|nr:YHS domain protein [Bacteroidota bacterium]
MNKLFILFIFSFFLCHAYSQESLRTKHFNINSKTVAVSGYDVVSYFTQNKAVEGDKKFSVTAEGVLYYFSSQANKDLFLKNWRNYEPQYGGWCAYAMGYSGQKVEIDPETFKVVDGKLYLFYHSWTNNTLTKWNKDERNLKAKADTNWKNIVR